MQHIVAMVDGKASGRAAVRSAVALARRTGARVSLLATPPAAPADVLAAIDTDTGGVPVRVEILAGVPAIEVSRWAERQAADLLVLGLCARAPGDAGICADPVEGVLRRARVPCLLVREGASLEFERMLVAVDTTVRAPAVLTAARRFATAAGSAAEAVTVEPSAPVASLPIVHAGHAIVRTFKPKAGWSPREARASGFPHVVERSGDPVGEVLAQREASHADVLALGYRTGGPAATPDSTGVGRRLASLAPCLVLTIPI